MVGCDPGVEYHDGDEKSVCVGQWCCGCAEHPIGKPWGWNFRAWEEHYDSRLCPGRGVMREAGPSSIPSPPVEP